MRSKEKEDRYDKAMELYQQGFSAKEITRATGISDSCVYQYAHKHGVKRPPGYNHRRFQSLSYHNEEVIEPIKMDGSLKADCLRLIEVFKKDPINRNG